MSVPRTRTAALCVAALLLPPAGAASQPELPPEAILRLGAHRFVHPDRVRRLAFLDGDRRIFSTCDDRIFRVWDVDFGRVLWASPAPTPDSPRPMDAVIAPDGSLVFITANGPNIGTVAVGSAASIRWREGVTGRSNDLAITADGRVAACVNRKEVILWDIADARERKRLDLGEAVRVLALSAGGRFAAAGGESETRLWDAADGRVLAKWSVEPTALAFTQDARLLAAALEIPLPGRTRVALKVFEVPGGGEKWETPGSFNEVAFSPDGSLLAATRHEGVTVFDSATGRVVKELAYGGNEHAYAVTFSSDGKMLAAGGDDTRIRFWKTEDWTEWRAAAGHEAAVTCVAFSPDGKTIVTGGKDRTLRLWDAAEGAELWKVDGIGSHWSVTQAVFSPDGARLAVHAGVVGGDSVTIRDATSGAKTASFAPGKINPPLAFLPDSRQLAAGMKDGSIAIWDAGTGARLRSAGTWKDDIEALQILPNTQSAAWAGKYEGIGIRDLATGEDVRMIEKARHGSDGTLATAGTLLVRGGRVWDTATGKTLREDIRRSDSRPSAISPDGRIVAWAGEDGIHLWELLTLREIHTLGPLTGKTHQIAFSPDGTMLASAGHDGSVLLWDVTGGERTGTIVRDFDALWKQLGSDDSWAARRAMWRLVRGGSLSLLSKLREKLRPASEPDPFLLLQLRDQLADPHYDTRDEAAQALVDMGVTLSPQEIEALRRPLPPPLGMPIVERPAHPWSFLILDTPLRRALPPHVVAAQTTWGVMPHKTEYGLPPELPPGTTRRRQERAIEALEHSKWPGAKALLQSLAGGWPSHPQTIAAKAALARMVARVAGSSD